MSNKIAAQLVLDAFQIRRVGNGVVNAWQFYAQIVTAVDDHRIVLPLQNLHVLLAHFFLAAQKGDFEPVEVVGDNISAPWLLLLFGRRHVLVGDALGVGLSTFLGAYGCAPGHSCPLHGQRLPTLIGGRLIVAAALTTLTIRSRAGLSARTARSRWSVLFVRISIHFYCSSLLGDYY